MTRRLLALLALVAQTCAAPAFAQRTTPRPSWALLRRATDQYGVANVDAPRIVHHAIHAAAGAEAYTLLRALHVADVPALLAGGALVSLAPHAVGVARGAYPFDGPDWIADAWIGTGGAMLAHAYTTRRHRLRTTALYLAGYALASGWTSP